MDKRKFIINNLFIKGSLFLFLINNLFAGSDIFSLIRIWHPSPDIIKTIQQSGIALDHSIIRPGAYLDLVVSQKEKIILVNHGLILETLINDLTSHYQNRNVPVISRDFPLGSMQGNYTWAELRQRHDDLRNSYPDIISEKIILGQSVEGNDIWAFKLSDNVNIDEDEPEILYTGLTHSREPLSMMNLFYFVQNLVNVYESDSASEENYLINERELWFVPVVNPDGYIYNEQIQPNGGGMHRKNRRETGCGPGTERGVDLNRNYGFGWGSDDIGSSPDPCSAVFRGDGAFSEPETQILRDFIINRNFKNVLHYHSFGNVYIHPFGDGSYPGAIDLMIYRGLAKDMSDFNNYNYGTGYETIGYTVNGDALDWTYGEQSIFTYTPEIGSTSNGFWPSENNIELLCKNQFEPNKIFALTASSDFKIHSYSFTDELISGSTVDINLEILNRGLESSFGALIVTLEPLSSLINIENQTKEISSLDTWEQGTVNFEINVSEHVNYFNTASIKVSLKDMKSFNHLDTIKFSLGSKISIYEENFDDNHSDWIFDGIWGYTNNPSLGEYALTDSPEGNYNPETDASVLMNFDFDFSFIANPFISFLAQWDIEENYDFVKFQAYTENDGWISLRGRHTVEGHGTPLQPTDEFGYEGSQSSWVQEIIYLDQLGGNDPLAFRFILNSDQFVEGDGFVFDSFSINGFPLGSRGDFSFDGVVNVFDIIGLADLLFNNEHPDQYILNFCDLDENGYLNILDLLMIINMVYN